MVPLPIMTAVLPAPAVLRSRNAEFSQIESPGEGYEVRSDDIILKVPSPFGTSRLAGIINAVASTTRCSAGDKGLVHTPGGGGNGGCAPTAPANKRTVGNRKRAIGFSLMNALPVEPSARWRNHRRLEPCQRMRLLTRSSERYGRSMLDWMVRTAAGPGERTSGRPRQIPWQRRYLVSRLSRDVVESIDPASVLVAVAVGPGPVSGISIQFRLNSRSRR